MKKILGVSIIFTLLFVPLVFADENQGILIRVGEKGVCSAGLIDPGTQFSHALLVTAYHCIDDLSPGSDFKLFFDADSHIEEKVTFRIPGLLTFKRPSLNIGKSLEERAFVVNQFTTLPEWDLAYIAVSRDLIPESFEILPMIAESQTVFKHPVENFKDDFKSDEVKDYSFSALGYPSGTGLQNLDCAFSGVGIPSTLEPKRGLWYDKAKLDYPLVFLQCEPAVTQILNSNGERKQKVTNLIKGISGGPVLLNGQFVGVVQMAARSYLDSPGFRMPVDWASFHSVFLPLSQENIFTDETGLPQINPRQKPNTVHRSHYFLSEGRGEYPEYYNSTQFLIEGFEMTFDDDGLLSRLTGYEFEPFGAFSSFSVDTRYTEREFVSGKLVKRDSYLMYPPVLIDLVKRRYYLKQSHSRPTQRARAFAWNSGHRQPEGVLIKDVLSIYADRDYSMGNKTVFVDQDDSGQVVDRSGLNFSLQNSMNQLYPWFD